jgi:uncharacterized protein YcfJ
MIDFNDLQKPLIAVLALGAAAAAGFAAGYLVGRDPETARRLAKTAASGMLRARVAAAEAMENLGDLWADARIDAVRDIEDERADALQATPVTEDASAPRRPAATAKTARKRKPAKASRARKAPRLTKRKPLAAAA